MSENTPTETPRQIQLHTMIMVLDLAGRSDQVFQSAKQLHANTLMHMIKTAQNLQVACRREPDVAQRMQMNRTAEGLLVSAQAFKDLCSAVELCGTIGLGNLDELRDGIVSLQKECGCEDCRRDAGANEAEHIAANQITPRKAPRFTGSYKEWVPRLIAEARARAEASQPSRIIQP